MTIPYTLVNLFLFDRNRLCAASGDKTAKRWDVDTGKCEATYEHPDFVKSVAVSGSYLITGCRDENVRIWDMPVKRVYSNIDLIF